MLDTNNILKNNDFVIALHMIHSLTNCITKMCIHFFLEVEAILRDVIKDNNISYVFYSLFVALKWTIIIVI